LNFLKQKKWFLIYLWIIMILPSISTAKIDLVTLPDRDQVDLILYKSPDMALVREIRSLPLKQGINELQFSWQNTRIDPDSIYMIPAKHTDGIQVENISFPANIRQMAIWKITSTQTISIPMQVRYLSSGIDWRAYYDGVLSTDEKTMHLKGYVRVNNHSGESFDNASLFLVMGSVNMLTPIDQLVQKDSPYGSPKKAKGHKLGKRQRKQERAFSLNAEMDAVMAAPPMPNVIRQSKASEYAIFELDQKESLKDKWGKQLVFRQDQAIPITNVYRFDPRRYAKKVVRLITFENTLPSDKKLGALPGGLIRVYRDIYKNQHFSYEGQVHIDDTPVGKKIELAMGEQNQVTVDQIRMKNRTDHYQFDKEGDIVSWEEFYQDRIKLNNTRDVSVELEIICSINATNWKLVQKDAWVTYERIDQHSVKFRVSLEKHMRKEFSYDVHIYHRNHPAKNFSRK